MLFVEALRCAEGAAGREAEALIGFALQGGEVEQCRSSLAGILAGLAGACFWLALQQLDDAISLFGVEDAIPGCISLRIKPGALVLVGTVTLDLEGGFEHPVGVRLMSQDLSLAADQHGQGRGLHAASGPDGLIAAGSKPDGEGAGRVHADEPVALCAAVGSVCQALHAVLGAGRVEALLNSVAGHGLEPQPIHGLFGFGEAIDLAKDELPFTAGVAGVDNAHYVLAADHLLERLELGAGTAYRAELELLGNDGEVFETPALQLVVIVFRLLEFEQVTDGP